MVTRYSTKENAPLGGGCSVALLDSCELQSEEYARYLSAAERAHYLRLPRQSRKNEWLAGRLAAKFLFLNRLELYRLTRSSHRRPTLLKLSSEALSVYSPWMYQRVEVLSNGARPNRYARLVWCGKDRPESISLSHAGGLSCACITPGTPTAIDVETAVPRIDAFYRNNFTKAERSWVAREAADDSVKSNWFFTLLWTLKESALKLGRLNHASIWNLPGIEIDGLPRLNRLDQFWFSKNLGGNFEIFTAGVNEDGRVMQVEAAVVGTRNLVLTVMNPLVGVTN
jgi:4'-phosphopantetheinyl transferase EntD